MIGVDLKEKVAKINIKSLRAKGIAIKWAFDQEYF